MAVARGLFVAVGEVEGIMGEKRAKLGSSASGSMLFLDIWVGVPY